MRRYESDSYSTVAICGSFGRHWEDICVARNTFIESGFDVVVPRGGEMVDKDADFILLEGDETDNPKDLEKEYLSRAIGADVVYICNTGGYVGSSVMFELGHLCNKSEVYFADKPTEPLIAEIASENIKSPEEVCQDMKLHSDVFSWRDWPDADNPVKANFTL
jgi:hypothetical protein